MTTTTTITRTQKGNGTWVYTDQDGRQLREGKVLYGWAALTDKGDGPVLTFHKTAAAAARGFKEARPTAQQVQVLTIQDAAEAQAAAEAEAPRKAAPRKAAPKKAAPEKAAPKGRPALDKLAAEHDPAPEGYVNKWPKVSFDLMKKVSGDGPAWLVRCVAHGTTTPAEGTRQGDSLGTRASRALWCKGCKAEARKAARQEAAQG